MKKLMAIVMAFAIMLTVCACGKNEASKSDAASKNNDSTAAATGDSDTAEPNVNKGIDVGGYMTLTKSGTMSRDVSFAGGIVYKTVGEGNNKRKQILKNNGEAFNDKTYSDIDAVVNNDICTVYNKDESGKKLFGVVDHKNGKELVPAEAASVSLLSDRFLLLGYETEQGTKDDYFDIYFINSETVYYKGYGKVLDLEKGQFVPGIEIATKIKVSAAGNVILIDKEYPKTEVYSADGKLIGTHGYIYACSSSDIVMQSTGGGIVVYDEDMKLVSTITTTDISDRYEAVDGSSEMLEHEYMKDGKRVYCVTDLSGKALSKEYEKISIIYPDYRLLKIEENGVSKLVDFAGNTIISGFDNVDVYQYGYIRATFGDNSYVYDITGKKISENAADDSFPLLVTDSDGKVICLSTGNPIEAEGSLEECVGALVRIGTTVYDIVSGKAVVTDVDDMLMVGDNYYMYDSDTDTFTCYSVEYK